MLQRTTVYSHSGLVYGKHRHIGMKWNVVEREWNLINNNETEYAIYLFPSSYYRTSTVSKGKSYNATSTWEIHITSRPVERRLLLQWA